MRPSKQNVRSSFGRYTVTTSLSSWWERNPPQLLFHGGLLARRSVPKGKEACGVGARKKGETSIFAA